MKRQLTFCHLCVSLLLLVHPGYAADTENEIAYLLTHVGNSECIFLRNGKEYQPVEAKDHLRRKYKHLHKKITSTELFIEKVASSSSFSGKKYQVRCHEEQLTANQWLYMALTNYRKQKSKSRISGSQNIDRQ